MQQKVTYVINKERKILNRDSSRQHNIYKQEREMSSERYQKKGRVKYRYQKKSRVKYPRSSGMEMVLVKEIMLFTSR